MLFYTMNSKIFRLILLVVISTYANSGIHSQVTIGNDEAPVAGALLQLKEQANITNGAANSLKGLGMPRMYLNSLTNLNDIDPTNTARPDRDEHVGLMVYNTNGCVNPLDGYEGLYVWDGTKWDMIGAPSMSSNVQIYQDQDGNDFKAATFGPAGTWMVENLRVSKYATNVTGQPALTLGLPLGKPTTSNYAYPAPSGDGKNAAYVTKQPSLGYLYNWRAASARATDVETTDDNSSTQAQYQGICPNGWHLPSDYEWNQLEQQIANNPQLYSKYPAGTATNWNTAWATTTSTRPTTITNPAVGYANSLLSTCPPVDFVAGSTKMYGQSLPATKGGFHVVLAGYSAQESSYSVNSYGTIGEYWTSSSQSSSGSWIRIFVQGEGGIRRNTTYRNFMISVRCKKN